VRCSAKDKGLQEWIQQNLSGNHDNPDWATKFGIILWYIWKWRCASCFEAIKGIPKEKEVFLLHKFWEVIQALAIDDQV